MSRNPLQALISVAHAALASHSRQLHQTQTTAGPTAAGMAGTRRANRCMHFALSWPRSTAWTPVAGLWSWVQLCGTRPARVRVWRTVARCGTGKFTYGNFSSKDCPVGSFAITTTISCQVAATAAEVPYISNPLAVPMYPCGCIWMKNQIQVNLNTAPNCAASADVRPVCALDQTLCCSTGYQPTPHRLPSPTNAILRSPHAHARNHTP